MAADGANAAAWLAICSDLDETPDAATYFAQMKFLNTTEESPLGPGVGLEVGNSMYFFMPSGNFSYWGASGEDREKIRLLIRAGYIDCLHSYGDLAVTRGHAERAIEELERHRCRFPVWVDHATAATNFGSDIMKGHGDEPGHPAYHADLSVGHGIRYIWRGRVTSVVGQDRPFSLGGIGHARAPFSSLETLGKEASKQVLGCLGSRKYAMHSGNRLLAPVLLRDGQRVVEFIRCNPSWGGVSCHDRGDGIHQVLTRRFLDRLAARGGYCILYTHLGKISRNSGGGFFSAEAAEAFRLLASYQREGRIRVTTTSRLLDRAAGVAEPDPPAALVFPDLG